MAQQHPELLAIGYFGSYARGDWSVGSDLDLIVIVSNASQDVFHRSTSWSVEELPVPADLLIYTENDWRSLDPTSRFSQTLRHETKWLYLAPNWHPFP